MNLIDIILNSIYILVIFLIKYNIFKIIAKGENNIKILIEKLKTFSDIREPKYYIFADLFTSAYCFDKNAYYLFDYYLNQKYNAYYIINPNSDLYKSLFEQNKTKNLILYDGDESFYSKLFLYLLNSKIIVLSYIKQCFLYKIFKDKPWSKIFQAYFP